MAGAEGEAAQTNAVIPGRRSAANPETRSPKALSALLDSGFAQARARPGMTA
jgi:hypothetical protein